jgi:hypothetical protein
VGEPPDGRLAGWVEDGQAVVVGGSQGLNGLFERLVGTKLGHFVDESSGALVRGARDRLFDVKGGDDAEQRAVGVDHG